MRVLISAAMVVGFLTIPYMTASVANASPLATTGPISGMELSNSTITEANGQVYIFNATGVLPSVTSTGLTATFSSGTASWAVGSDNGAITSGNPVTVPLAFGNNTITVTHTLSGTNTVYTISILRGGQFSNMEIRTSGMSLSPAFSPTVFEYTMADVPYTTTSISYIVTHTFNDAGYLECNKCDWWQFQSRGEQSFTLSTGLNRIDWSFNPGVGPIIHYYINITRASTFDSTHLEALTLSNSTLREQSGQLYRFDSDGVLSTVASTNLTATFSSGTATWANGSNNGALTSGVARSIPLDYGNNTITVTHTLSGVNTLYRIYILRGGQFSNMEIQTPGMSLSPAFSPTVFEYTMADVPYSTTSISYIVTHTFNDAGYLECNKCDWWQFQSRGAQSFTLNTGLNRIDWSFNPGIGPILHYYINITRASTFDSTHLQNLTVSNSTLREQSGQLYRFDSDGVLSTVTSTNLTATFSSGTATWANGSSNGALTSGTARSIPLAYGNNTITVTHSLSGVNTVYTVYMLRGGQFADIQIQTSGVSLSPAFDPDVFYYRLTDVGYSTTSISYLVTHTFNDAGYLECNQCDWWQYQSRGAQSFTLNNGANCIDWSFNPGVGPTIHYYIAVNRNAPGTAQTGNCVVPAAVVTTTTSPPTTTTTVPKTTTTLASSGTTTTTAAPSQSVTTTTIVSVTATTVASTATTAPASPAVTIAQGQVSVATIAPTASTTPVAAATGVASATTTTTTTSPSTTTTTLPAEVTPVAAPATPAPTVAALEIGRAGMTVDGRTIEVAISRVDNQVIVSGGGVTMTVSVLSVNGERVPLDSAGGLRFNTGDKVVMTSEGLSPGDEMTFWMFSTPTALGIVTVGADGIAAGTFAIPAGLEKGGHRLVLQGVNKEGKKIVLGVGVGVGKIDSSSTTSRVLIAIPVALAVGLGITLPNQVRRRRRKRLVVA